MSDEIELYCPQCGEETDQLFEGYCAECCHENQLALDAHNRGWDEWYQLSTEQRDKRIRDAMNKD